MEKTLFCAPVCFGYKAERHVSCLCIALAILYRGIHPIYLKE